MSVPTEIVRKAHGENLQGYVIVIGQRGLGGSEVAYSPRLTTTIHLNLALAAKNPVTGERSERLQSSETRRAIVNTEVNIP